jgi:hypothetical protein
VNNKQLAKTDKYLQLVIWNENLIG